MTNTAVGCSGPVDLFLVLGWLGVAFNLKQRIVRPLQTLSNILGAIREGDYSIRGRRAIEGDALGEVMLRGKRPRPNTARTATRRDGSDGPAATVMGEIDVVVFAFDGEQRLRLVNRAGERLLAQPATRLLGRTSVELGLASCLDPKPVKVHHDADGFPGGVGSVGHSAQHVSRGRRSARSCWC